MTTATPGIVGVLLAAGAGTRFGSHKLMHPLADGTPMAVAAASALQPACDHLVAVIRPGDDDLAAILIGTGCEIVWCSEAEGGMGHSLAAGIRATASASGWIVALADMPFITHASNKLVAANLRAGARLVALQFQGKQGHPVGFSQAWRRQLIVMSGDRGAKILLEKHRQHLVLCSVDDPGVVWDIDCRDDFKKHGVGGEPAHMG
ncbi:MAG: nucleotidyltransferase family protein [Pseudomonadota bacterium]